MEFLPLDAGVADVALLNGTLHYTRCAQNVLAEARRVLAPGGALVVLDTPVYRRAADGEAMLRARRRKFVAEYGYAPDRDSAAGYFTLGELRRLLHRSGLAVQTFGWPGRLREAARDLIEIARHGRRTARFPMVVARKAASSA
jgi:SAM-dependent methyltransferase